MKKVKANRISLSSRHSLYGYLFISPFIIGLILFFMTPLVLFVSMSFNDVRPSDNGLVFSFAGLEYYKKILIESTDYITEVIRSFSGILMSLPAIVLFSFFIATVLKHKFRGRTFFRAVFFLPVIVASGVQVMSQSDAVAQNAIAALSGTAASTSEDTLNLARYVISLLGPDYISVVNKYIQPLISNIYTITSSSGVQILIFLAALQTVPPSLYEAANIDGATSWESFWKITLPYLKPMIAVNIVYTFIDLLGNQNNEVVVDIYETVNAQMRFSQGASMGTLYFSIVFALMGLLVLILSKFLYSKDRL